MNTFKAITGLAIAAAALTAGTAQAQTLVDRYSFNDTGATVTDSVGGQNGTLAGGATEVGGSLVTTGTGSVTLGTSYTLPVGAMSIEDFFTPTAGANTGFNTLYSFSIDGGNNYLVAVAGRGGDGKPSVDLKVGGTQNVSQAATTVIAGQVNQFVATYDGVNESVYLNGVLSFQSPDTKFPSDQGVPVGPKNGIAGNSPFNDPALQGSTQDLRIYKGALSGTQVAASFQAGPDKLPGAVPEASSSVALGLMLALGGLVVVARKKSLKA